MVGSPPKAHSRQFDEEDPLHLCSQGTMVEVQADSRFGKDILCHREYAA